MNEINRINYNVYEEELYKRNILSRKLYKFLMDEKCNEYVVSSEYYCGKNIEKKYVKKNIIENCYEFVEIKNGNEYISRVEFYKNKIKKLESYYKNGIKNGEFISYHENGKIKYKINYKNGKKDGYLSYHDKNGYIIYSYKYNNDELMEYDKYDHDKDYSQITIQERYKNGIKTHIMERRKERLMKFYENGNKLISCKFIFGSNNFDNFYVKYYKNQYITKYKKTSHHPLYKNKQIFFY